jgi:hypothetical protein
MDRAGAATDVKASLQRAEAHARHAVRKASPWVGLLGRFGLVAKGCVYVVIGWIALQAAIHDGGHVVDQRGALRQVFQHTFGTIMLAALTVGLFGYMTWCVARALFNPEREPHDLKGYSKRVFRAGSGIAYGGLGVAAARLLVGMRARHTSARDWSRWFMQQPFGKTLLAMIGIGIAVYGVTRVFKAWKGGLKEELVLEGVAGRVAHSILAMGRIGHGVRGVVFIIIGVFAVIAAAHANPEEAKGIAESLSYLAGKPYGPYLLGIVAVGLIAYGLFQFIEARYRRIQVD